MNLLRFIDLVDLQARASLKSEASRMYLSYLWWILEPMLFVFVFYLVFKVLLNRGGEDFIFFLMCGKIPYLWVNKSIMSSCDSLLANRGLIGKLDVPKELFPYISMQEVLYKQWVVFLLLFVTAIFFGQAPTLQWLWLIPITISMYIMIVPASLLAALLCTWAQDFRIFISMGLLFVMFASGIFWDVREIQNEAARDLMLTLNPMSFMIEQYRNVLMYNEPVNYQHMMLLSIIFIAFAFFLHGIYRNLRYQITQRILES